MKEIEAALRTFYLTVPRDLVEENRIGRERRFPAVQIESWNQEQLLPTIYGLWNRPSFRREAKYMLGAFREGESTPEWQHVENLASIIQDAGRATLTLAKGAAERGQIPSLSTAHDRQKRGSGELRAVESVIISAGKPPEVVRFPAGESAESQLTIDLLRVESARKRRALELVSANDYFGALQDATVQLDGKTIAAGMFLSLVNPRIRFVGNFIIRSFLARVAIDVQAIGRLLDAASNRVREPRNRRAKELAGVAYDALRQQVELVENIFVRSPEAQLRDARMALVQFAVDWTNSQLATDWLMIPHDVLRARRLQLRYHLTSGRNYQALEQIVHALEAVQQLYANARPIDESIEKAIATGGLVFVGELIYWAGEPLPENATRGSRHLLRRLAERARCGLAIEDFDVDPNSEAASRSTMPMRIKRLKESLPLLLQEKIVPGQEPGTYILKLRTSDLHFIEVAEESLV